jgi:hypothetical protein
MHVPGDAFRRRLSVERGRALRARVRRRFVTALALFAPLAVVAAVHARVAGLSPADAAGRALLVFALAAAGAVAYALFALRGAPPVAVVAARLDDVAAADDPARAGLCAAAAHAAETPSYWAPLVLARADAVADGIAPLVHPGPPRWCGPRAATWLLIALAAAFAPTGPEGVLGGADAAGAKSGARGAASRPTSSDPEREADAADPRPDLRDLARLSLKAGRRTLAENEELVLGLELLMDRAVADAVPLEVVLAVADGLPSPDQGFGVGWRVARLALDWRTPRENGGRLTHLQSMNEALDAIGIPRRGMLTFVAAARVADPYASVKGGVLSEPLTVRFSPNVEKSRTEAPTPAPTAKGESKAKPEPKPDDRKKDGEARGKKPELGAPEELPDAQTYASLVRPLFNDGPTVEKDVAVYEREKGAVATPPPPPTAEDAGAPARTFERRAEAALRRAAASPAEREALRRYFALLRGERGP